MPHNWPLLSLGAWIYSLWRSVRKLGGVGLFILGVLDSSFLFLPFGNDLLLISLVSSDPSSLTRLFYVLMATLGSTTGVLLLDSVTRKAGEEGLERLIDRKRTEKLKSKVKKNVGWTLFTATVMPPPFPFTAVVLTASALQSSRKKMLVSVFFGRLTRFTVEAILALYFGQKVIRYLNSGVVVYLVCALFIVAIIGTFLTLRKRFRKGRTRARRRAAAK